MGSRNSPGCKCCDGGGSTPCTIHLDCTAKDACTNAGIVVAVTVSQSGTTVATGMTGTLITFTGVYGIYDITYKLTFPNTFSRKVNQNLGCGPSLNSNNQLFMRTLSVGIQGDYVVKDVGPPVQLTTATETLSGVLVWAEYLGTPCTPTYTSSSMTNILQLTSDIGTGVPAIGTTSIEFFATYLGRTCTCHYSGGGSGCGSGSGIVFQTGGGNMFTGCNMMPLPGVNVVGPSGETAVSDGDGVALIHPYLAGHCLATDIVDTNYWTCTKARFISQTITDWPFALNPVTHLIYFIGAYQLLPDGGAYGTGYACCGCCVDPLKNTLFGTIANSLNGSTDNYILSYDISL